MINQALPLRKDAKFCLFSPVTNFRKRIEKKNLPKRARQRSRNSQFANTHRSRDYEIDHEAIRSIAMYKMYNINEVDRVGKLDSHRHVRRKTRDDSR
jgi:hypothetical protein